MENIKRVPASGKTGTAQKTSNGQEASDSRIAAYNDIIGLDGDLGDLAQAAQTATGSEAFATIFAQSFGAHRKQRATGRWPGSKHLLDIIQAAIGNRVERNVVIGDRTLTDWLEAMTRGGSITAAWAKQVRERATLERKTDFLAGLPPIIIKPLSNWIFDLIWQAERTPIEAVRHTTASQLHNLFLYIADRTEDEQTATLSVLDDTHLGACLAEHGGIPQAWADFQAERAAAARQKELDRLHEIYGHNHFKDDDHDDDPLGDAQGQPPAVWGGGSDVLWSAGETLIIEAHIGLGKTSLAGLLVRALLFAGEVLGQPVKQLAPGQKVLYLALDRPDQIKRSMARQFTPEQRAALPRPPRGLGQAAARQDTAENQNVLRDLAEFHNAAVVVVDRSRMPRGACPTNG